MKLSFRSFLLVICLWCTRSEAQDQKSFSADTARVNQLLQSAKQKFSEEPAKAFALASEATKLARQSGYAKGEALGLKNTAIFYYYQGKLLEALDFYEQSIKIFQSIN